MDFVDQTVVCILINWEFKALATKKISGDSKGVDNNQVLTTNRCGFDSITSSGKGFNGYYTYMAFHYNSKGNFDL